MIRPPHRLPGSRAAFTLLEVLVATAVSAIVLLVIGATFFAALRLNTTTHDRLATDLELQRALGIVRRDLAGVMLPRGQLSGQLQTTLASALTQGTYGDQVGPDLYTNTGTVDGWTQFSEVQLVDYYLAPANDGTNRKTLVRAVTRNLLPAQADVPNLQPLLTGVADASIDFYDGTTWTSAWDSASTRTMPTAIRFQVVPARTDVNQPAGDPVTLIVPVLVSTATQATTGGTGS